MPYQNTLQEINELKAKIDTYGRLSPEVLKKINYKFRLEWNYTSNSMEGNSLTRRETRTVMVGLVGVNDKPIKDVMEIRKHDAVITTIMQIGAGELNISEKRIKEIHKGIMYEEDPEKLEHVGEWKNVDNYLINERGERFDFIPHTEIREKIHELINWLNAEKEKIERKDKHALHPAILAFKFHIDYLTIHPFYDGNGRTARILTNLILISSGLPPVYIKEEEKGSYYQYLTDIQGYGGDPDLFYDFMARLLLRSLQIVLNGIEGKELEEPEDYLKELELVKRKLQNEPVVKSPKVVYDTCLTIEHSLWKPLISSLVPFSELFNESKETREVNGMPEQFKSERKSIFAPLMYEESNGPKSITIFGHDVYETDIWYISWEVTKYGLKGAASPTNFKIVVNVYFDHSSYRVSITATGKPDKNIFLSNIAEVTKDYGTSWEEEEIQKIRTDLGKHMVKTIKYYTEESGDL